VSKIEIGRYSELLRRSLGMKGTVEVAGELSPEVSATIELEGPAPEWDFLKQVRGCRAANTLPGVVANTVHYRLRNPAGSGTLATIQALGLTPASVAELRINRGQIGGELLTLLVTVVPDTRWGAIGTTTTSLLFSGTNADASGPAGDLIATGAALANSQFLYRQPVVLNPGDSLDWGIINTNVRLYTWISWIERQLPALEE